MLYAEEPEMINQKLIEIVTIKPFNEAAAQALKSEIENQCPTVDDLRKFVIEIDEEMQASSGDILLNLGIINRCAIYMLRDRMKLDMPKIDHMAFLMQEQRRHIHLI